MKKLIKLTLLLLISISVDCKTTCSSTCPLKAALEANLRSANNDQQTIDENDWILNTRFKY